MASVSVRTAGAALPAQLASATPPSTATMASVSKARVAVCPAGPASSVTRWRPVLAHRHATATAFARTARALATMDSLDRTVPTFSIARLAATTSCALATATATKPPANATKDSVAATVMTNLPATVNVTIAGCAVARLPTFYVTATTGMRVTAARQR